MCIVTLAAGDRALFLRFSDAGLTNGFLPRPGVDSVMSGDMGVGVALDGVHAAASSCCTAVVNMKSSL